MFNTGSFNKSRFNIGAEDDSDVRLVVSMVSTFSAIIATGGNLYVTETANDSFSMRSDIAAGEPLGATILSGDTDADASGVVHFCLADTLTGMFSGAADASEDITLSVDAIDGLLANAYPSFDSYLDIQFVDSMIDNVEFGSDYRMPAIAMASIMDAQVTSIQFDVDYVTINMTLCPGQSLVIDSDNFVVLHDGNNAIQTHSGVWPMLARETFDVQVSSGAVSDLVTSILYTERYL